MKLTAEARTERLLDAAVNLAQRDGFHALTRAAIAKAAGVSDGLVSQRLGTMSELRRSVMRAAIARRCLRVIAEGLAANDRQACKAPDELKAAAAAWVGRA